MDTQSGFSLFRLWFPDIPRPSFQAWSSLGTLSNRDMPLSDHGSEIYQVTGPVERFAGQIASQGYVVGG